MKEKKEIFKGNFERKFQQQSASLFGGVSPPEPPKKTKTKKQNREIKKQVDFAE